MPRFVVYNYPADGEDACARDEAWFSDAHAAFAEAALRLGDLDEWRRWIGFEPAESGLSRSQHSARAESLAAAACKSHTCQTRHPR